MDSLVIKKQHKKSNSQQQGYSHRSHATHADRFCRPSNDRGNDVYHIYQLGRPYRAEEGHFHCYDGANDPREQFDVRAYLYEDGDDGKDAQSCINEQKNASFDTDKLSRENAHVVDQDVDIPEHQFTFGEVPILQHDSMILSRHISHKYAAVMGIAFAFVVSLVFVGTTFAVKEKVDDAGHKAIISLKNAMGSIARSDFDASQEELDGAYQEFVVASEEMGRINGVATYLSKFVPWASALSSGNHIVEAGKYLTHSAKELHSVIPAIIEKDDQLISPDGKHVSFLALYQLIADRMDVARFDLASAQSHIEQVRVDDVPEEYRTTFVEIKELLPEVNTSLRLVTESRPTIEDILGAHGPRTYLLLFQNNHEMRATGGFIGSYGIVRIKNGQIEKLFIDDVYNPDGQLIDRVVPPLPIQKISADWSLHDSNWFADYPVSAKKAMDFYERTGGPTVDGVIAITPEMMQKFLRITGPIELSDYDMTLTDENFMQVMQDEVEDRENYQLHPSETEKNMEETFSQEDDDKDPTQEQGSSKQILADIVPIMLDRLFDVKNPKYLSAVASSISSGLKERHILLYMTNADAQKIIEQNGWSGSVLHTDKDYLSVVNTNINGFKTDGVISEKISHTAKINENGEVINTVKITRHHEGGHTGFPWWDAVNANYMRIYVPEGSELLAVEGQTREINTERLSYDALGYERDRDVAHEESAMRIDEETGTRIYTESGKTVFANWAYVSPQETVTVTYTYKLPFAVAFDTDAEGDFGSYAILFQKQSGSERSTIESVIDLPDAFTQVWHAHDDKDLRLVNDLTTDRYNGAVFRVQ